MRMLKDQSVLGSIPYSTHRAFMPVPVRDRAGSLAAFQAQNLKCAGDLSSGYAQQQLPKNLSLHSWLRVRCCQRRVTLGTARRQ